MDSSSIPIPLSQRWREFRIRVVPVLAFAVGLVFVVDLWRSEVTAPSMTGEVERVQAGVVSILPGTLAELEVDRFQKVQKGQVIGRILPLDPEALQASLAAMEIDLRLLRARLAVDRERNDLDYQQLRLDHMTRRLELAAGQANLQFAESTLLRLQQEHRDKIASDFDFDVAVRDRDRFRAEVSERTLIVSELEQALERFRPPGPASSEESADPMSAAIAAHEAKLLLLDGPVTLHAPIDGMVNSINFRPGEKVMAGQPIVTISAMTSDRIVGYVRQPLRVVPKVGDDVQIRTRGSNRQVGYAKILQVGAEMQMVSGPMRIRSYDTSQERGLPFMVALPPELELFPGELVELILKR